MSRHTIAGRRIDPPAATCWCGTPRCEIHSDYCARCGWRRIRANLTTAGRANLYRGTHDRALLVCRDRCEGRPSQWD
jgi:hypothetical protein